MEAMITPSKKKVLQEISSNTPRRGKLGLQGKVKDMAILPAALQFKKAQEGGGAAGAAPTPTPTKNAVKPVDLGTPSRARRPLSPLADSAIKVFDDLLFAAMSPAHPPPGYTGPMPFSSPCTLASGGGAAQPLSPLSPSSGEATPSPASSPRLPTSSGRFEQPSSIIQEEGLNSALEKPGSVHTVKHLGAQGRCPDAASTLGDAMMRLQQELQMLGQQLSAPNATSSTSLQRQPPSSEAASSATHSQPLQTSSARAIPVRSSSSSCRPSMTPASCQTAPLPRGVDALVQASSHSKSGSTQTDKDAILSSEEAVSLKQAATEVQRQLAEERRETKSLAHNLAIVTRTSTEALRCKEGQISSMQECITELEERCKELDLQLSCKREECEGLKREMAEQGVKHDEQVEVLMERIRWMHDINRESSTSLRLERERDSAEAEAVRQRCAEEREVEGGREKEREREKWERERDERDKEKREKEREEREKEEREREREAREEMRAVEERAEARLERALREQKQAIEAGQAAAESAAYSLFQRLNDAHNLLFLQQTQIDLLLGGQAGGAARPGFGGGGRVCESAEVKELKLKHDAEIRELVRLVSASRPRMVDAACGMQEEEEEEEEKCDSA